MNARRIAGAVMVLLAVAVVGAAQTDNAKKLLGKWELVKGEGPKGAIIEFTDDGKMKLEAKLGDKAIKADGTYKLQGNSIATKISFGGKTQSETSTIKKLTDTELIVEDEKGKVEEYRRLK
jgi:uncharacterized protein (TIGR03066 family)